MAPPFNPLAPCCDPVVDDGCGADPNGEFCPEIVFGQKQYCMTLNTYIGGLRCRCADATTAKALRKLGWERKNNQIARVDKPGREIQLLIASLLPTTPDQLEELLMSMPPWISKAIGGGGNNPLPDHPPAFPFSSFYP